nr:hypothetical protein [Tanacetum cinerariifolium]
MAFVSTPSTSNNDDVFTIFGVITASPKVSTAYLSDATVYAFLANQPNGSQPVHEDLKQIHEDDLEEMDFKCGSDTAGYNKAKVECFNSHNMGHFTRECRVPRNQENKTRNHETTKRTVNMEDTSSKAMVAIDGVGFDWSYMANDEAPTNMAFVDFLDLEKTMMHHWESEGEDEVKSPPEIERKNVKPSVDKVEVDIPKQNDKPARRPVKCAEMYRTQRPRVLNAVKANKGNAVKASACWGHSHKQLEYQQYFNNGCSRHMTQNISYLTNYKEFDGGYVTFRKGAKGGKIIGKGIIRTGKLDFKDVYFVKELKFNLLSVLQMCDKKNSVYFNDTKCFVLSPHFKLANEARVLLNVPRKNNMYSVDMKNIDPKLVLLQRPQMMNQCFGTGDMRKQHKVSIKSKTQNSITQPLFMLHMDLFGPTFVSSLMHKKYCLVVTDDFSRFTWVFFLATMDETSRILKKFITEIENLVDKKVKIIRCDNGTKFKNRAMNSYVRKRVLVIKPYFKTPYELFRGKFDGKSYEGFFVVYSTNSKAFRVYNIRTRKVEENRHINFLENKPIIAGDGPKWLFYIHALTESINYVPVITDLDGNNKDNYGPCKESEIDNQERPNDKNSTKDVNIAGPSINTTSSNINTASLTVNTVKQSDDFFGVDNNMRSLDGVQVDISNISTIYHVLTTQNTRIHKDHSLDNVIGDMQSGELCIEFKKLMRDKFQMSSLGELTFFLGLQVKQKSAGIFIGQDKYVDEILRKFKYCKKQTVVATSTTKAEYVAAASCCGQVLLNQNQLLGFRINYWIMDFSAHQVSQDYNSPEKSMLKNLKIKLWRGGGGNVWQRGAAVVVVLEAVAARGGEWCDGSSRSEWGAFLRLRGNRFYVTIKDQKSKSQVKPEKSKGKVEVHICTTQRKSERLDQEDEACLNGFEPLAYDNVSGFPDE